MDEGGEGRRRVGEELKSRHADASFTECSSAVMILGRFFFLFLLQCRLMLARGVWWLWLWCWCWCWWWWWWGGGGGACWDSDRDTGNDEVLPNVFILRVWVRF